MNNFRVTDVISHGFQLAISNEEQLVLHWATATLVLKKYMNYSYLSVFDFKVNAKLTLYVNK